MTRLRIFSEANAASPQIETDLKLEIAELLADEDVNYQHLDVDLNFAPDIRPQDLARRLNTELTATSCLQRYQVSQLVAVGEGYPNLQRLQMKMLSEHQKEDNEAYLIVDGSCLLTLHIGNQVLQLFCEKGDFIDLPAEVKRWLDFGTQPNLTMMKFLHKQEEPAAIYTGEKIADHFPRYQHSF